MAKAKDDTPAKTKADSTVLDRLTALERQNRTLKRIAIGLAVFTSLTLAAAIAALVAPYNAPLGFYLGELLGRPEVVEAKKTILEAEQFSLRAADGKVRATLGIRDEKALGLDLYDENGRARAGLDLGPDGQPSVWLASEDGQVGLSFNTRGVRVADPAGGGSFLTAGGWSLVDHNQKVRLSLGLRDEFPALTLYDREGRNGALIDVTTDGTRLGLFHGGVVRAGIGYGRGGSQLNLFGDDGRDHATLGLNPDGSAALLFHDQEGKQRVAFGLLPNDVSGLSVFDKSERQRAGLSVAGDGSPHLELFDGGGTRRAGLALSLEGLPALQLEDRGQPRVVLGAGLPDGKRPAGKGVSISSLLLFDKDGSLVFQAPVY